MRAPTDARPPDIDVYVRALGARDARFDGIFFVGITTTNIYCRPICPARVSHPEHRRFFDSAAAAESAGFRPCRRCRPELAPGRGLIHAVSRLAYAAVHRIACGGLNGRGVKDLARDLCVSERHLRRALRSAMGVSPVQLAQTHRLLLAKRLLTDTTLPVTRVAFTSGFQSLRRFNAVFRERYDMAPSDLRRTPQLNGGRSASRDATPAVQSSDAVRLTLAYRAPFAWDVLIALLRRRAVPGVELVDGCVFGRTVRLGGHSGFVFAYDAAACGPGRRSMRQATRASSAMPGAGSALFGRTNAHRRSHRTHLNVDVSVSLLPVLMPLIARLRQLFDLDAEPTAIDSCLGRAGLGPLVARRPGLRILGAFDGFEIGLSLLLHDAASNDEAAAYLARRVTCDLGETIDTAIPRLTRLAPHAERVADAGAARLIALGVHRGRAGAIAAFAQAVADGTLALEPGGDVNATHHALKEIEGVGDRLATAIVTRALGWPDAFPSYDPVLQRAAGASTPGELRVRAEAWRPWRAYAALHLSIHDQER